ncbi:hypothetical protein VJ923_12015 [Adlercreutzia sp. R25]|uniref:hypothetical protein n=1 Tax=Adlercreutzia shanghongiae TaxID=3111773 RepID=UPI002DBEE6B1|nr:hypothetical protein [Adlercreutzia sp. R25]MEC4273884.1 hypothetical protein [Adlercreutzia sp. R25]
MTFSEFVETLKHYRKVFLCSVALCAIAGLILAFAVGTSKFEATSTLTAVDPSGGTPTSEMVSIIRSNAEDLLKEFGFTSKNSQVTIGTGQNANIVSVTIRMRDKEQTIETVNSIAHETAQETGTYYDELKSRYDESELKEDIAENLSNEDEAWNMTLLQHLLASKTLFQYPEIIVDDALKAEKSGVGPLSLGIIAGILGFCVAFAAIFVSGLVRKPIKNLSMLRHMSDIPSFSGEDADIIMIHQLLDREEERGKRGSIALLPLTSADCSPVLEKLSAGIAEAGWIACSGENNGKDANAPMSVEDGKHADRCIDIEICPSFCDGSSGRKTAADSDCVIVCVRCWEDTATSLENAVECLRYMGASVAAIVVTS